MNICKKHNDLNSHEKDIYLLFSQNYRFILIFFKKKNISFLKQYSNLLDKE